MLERTLELARGAGATAADALLRDTETLTISFEAGRLKTTGLSQEAGLNLRVLAGGRVGAAGTTDLAGTEDVAARALASAAEGEPLELELPGPAPAPPVTTFDDRAAGMAVEDLAALGRSVVEQLKRSGWQVNVTVERVVQSTSFASTTGQHFAYRATAVSVSAEVTRVAGDDVLMAYDVAAGVAPPGDGTLATLATTIVTKIERSERIVEPPEGRLPVLFTPWGCTAVLMPVRQALSGKTVLQGISPLGARLGESVFSTALSLYDDPLLDGAVGSRPVDDEGVPSAPLALIERGVVRSFVYDLETATRAGARSTGHGTRTVFGKPAIGYSNLLIAAGTMDETALLAELGSGLVVDELIGVGQGNVVGGAFSHPVALAWRVDGGELTGRVKEATVAGNAYDLLSRIRAVGKERRWIGTQLIPALVLEDVSVARRG
ncbi:MAG TPA: TldD/PmbA family protein [Gemmatimonadales bacterium]|nr:TldD/PmbA family protein [Gemmatimonadales bacterium]